MTLGPRIAAALVTMALGACASRPVVPGPTAGLPYRPVFTCNAEGATPQMIETSAAVLAPALWEGHADWEAQLRFRIDEAGTPTAIRASVSSFDGDVDAAEHATVDAFSHYRFCPPTAYSTVTTWSARMRFRYARVGNGAMYVQLFLPSYTRAEVRDGRRGTVVVRASFEPDGHPATLRVATSSGDPVLDQKSIEAMASYQLAFKPGTVLSRPVEYEQRYVYDIR